MTYLKLLGKIFVEKSVKRYRIGNAIGIGIAIGIAFGIAKRFAIYYIRKKFGVTDGQSSTIQFRWDGD
jgi:hypothetical protein